MKTWEWIAWGIMRLIGLVAGLFVLIVMAILGLIIGFILYSAWLDGMLYEVMLVVVVGGVGIVALCAALCYLIDLNDRLEDKRLTRGVK